MKYPQALDPNNRYIFTDYQERRPFASFLPGIAGPTGIPMWVFYVNRGQAIAGFGVESKDSPLMEFQPANKAYQSTPYTGFRTFIKINRANQAQYYEPFAAAGKAAAEQNMVIGANELELVEQNETAGLRATITYFTLPGENFAALARAVTLQNTGADPVSLEILDGLPVLIPYGVNNSLLKEINRTIEAWMEVYNLEAGVPFYHLRASVIDRVEVETYQAGHFALAFVEQSGESRLLPALVDPVTVFGSDTSFTQPAAFLRQPLSTLLAARPVTCGRTPCGLFAHQADLLPTQSLTIYSLYGHTAGLEILNQHAGRIAQADYFKKKHAEAVALADALTSVSETHTASPIFDAYCRQNFLDNILRGGWPVLFGDQPYPIYSRKHGDLERDYNAFYLAPESYSQGEGSYRDVNQNRREDVFFNPRIGDYHIRTFMSLIQTDGYNPRTVRGSTFTLTPEQQSAVLSQLPDPGSLRPVLAKPFTPGRLLKHILDHTVTLPVSPEQFIAQVLQDAQQHIQADFFEGYWIDHWEYNLDLIESYLGVYPERQHDLLFGQAGLPFYDSPAVVQPRSKKYILSNGAPRQVGSLLEDPEKAARIASRAELPHWSRTARGDIYHAALFAKMALTVLLKFAALDPCGMGIEMEASRPGWYDALNGLPALFGSGMSETFELQRWILFLRKAIQASPSETLRLPVEAAALLAEVRQHLQIFNQDSGAERDFSYWDAVSTARETYRERTRMGFSGDEQVVQLADLDQTLVSFEAKVAAGIERALLLNHGIPPTYFTYQVQEYDILPDKDPQGRPYIRAKSFTPQALPLFLEGPVHAYKVLPREAAKILHRQVKASPLFDAKLRMYKVNASLNSQPHDIGRARAFPPGWLENESIWLHMEYKYLLETLKAGLYEEFFEDFRACLIPFLDPQMYGRSPLENSSFLVSSAHPDESLHGAGFVARLSGSTAEFISIWRNLFAGPQPFVMHGSELYLALRPALPGWLFPENGQISFRFLGCCTVNLHNPRRVDTYEPGAAIQKIVLHPSSGNPVDILSGTIPAPYAEQVRGGQIPSLDIFFS